MLEAIIDLVTVVIDLIKSLIVLAYRAVSRAFRYHFSPQFKEEIDNLNLSPVARLLNVYGGLMLLVVAVLWLLWALN